MDESGPRKAGSGMWMWFISVTISPYTAELMTRLLEFRNVTVIKGRGKKVLDLFSITVDEGENIAILGPNGAGNHP
jgi:ABC-type molybdenum transport system ATPase subunit/photorepair protein PhrA